LQVTRLTEGDSAYDQINIMDQIADKTINVSDVKYQPYEITLLDENNQTVQPEGTVTVKIPCPEGYDGAACKVYYMAEDGTLKDMQAVYSGGYLTFETTHFSTYLVTETELEATVEKDILHGDANGDGVVNIKDSALIRRYAAGWNIDIDITASDVNADGVVNIKDSALVRRYAAGWNVTLK
jgi:hypothetical protein